MTDLAKLAAGLTEAQRRAMMSLRWINPGGHSPIALVDFTSPWMVEGVAQFFTMTTDRLTPLGLELARHLLDQEKNRVILGPQCKAGG